MPETNKPTSQVNKPTNKPDTLETNEERKAELRSIDRDRDRDRDDRDDKDGKDDQTYIVHEEVTTDSEGVVHRKPNRMTTEEYQERAQKEGW